MKITHRQLVISVTAVVLLFSCTAVHAANSWAEVQSLSTKAQQLNSQGKADEAAKVLIQAIQIRKTLPPLVGKFNTKNQDELTCFDLEATFAGIALHYVNGKRFRDAITFFNWHLSDPLHLKKLTFISNYAAIGDCYQELGNMAEAEKAYKESFDRFEAAQAELNDNEKDISKKCLLRYPELLKKQNKQQEAQAVSVKIATAHS